MKPLEVKNADGSSGGKPTDGGPAFPCGSGDMRDPVGMSLRDYFAAKAMNGMLSGTPDGEQGAIDEHVAGFMATEAYILADAMLRARTKEGI